MKSPLDLPGVSRNGSHQERLSDDAGARVRRIAERRSEVDVIRYVEGFKEQFETAATPDCNRLREPQIQRACTDPVSTATH